MFKNQFLKLTLSENQYFGDVTKGTDTFDMLVPPE